MSTFEQIIFGKKTYGDLLKDIYENQKKKAKQVDRLLDHMQGMVEDGQVGLEAIIPQIKECLDSGIKNDDNLIKAASIVQRSLNNSTKEDNLLISDSEKEQLLALSKELTEGK